jgi:hypothetical protein
MKGVRENIGFGRNTINQLSTGLMDNFTSHITNSFVYLSEFSHHL